MLVTLLHLCGNQGMRGNDIHLLLRVVFCYLCQYFTSDISPLCLSYGIHLTPDTALNTLDVKILRVTEGRSWLR